MDPTLQLSAPSLYSPVAAPVAVGSHPNQIQPMGVPSVHSAPYGPGFIQGIFGPSQFQAPTGVLQPRERQAGMRQAMLAAMQQAQAGRQVPSQQNPDPMQGNLHQPPNAAII